MTQELMVRGQELQQGHSAWSRETENKTSPGAQQPVKMGEAILQWGKPAVNSKGWPSDIPALPDQTLCALHVLCDFSLHLQAVLSLNSSFASPVTFKTSMAS